MITAHGGAMNTGRNSYRYFRKIAGYKIDAIEVDICMRKNTLVLAHILPPLFVKRAIKLSFVFEFCKKNNVMVNCDNKRRNLVKPILELAKSMDAERYIYFTGNVCADEIKNLDGGSAYVNNGFYADICPLSTQNLPKIKAYLDSFRNERIKGINISYRYATSEFLAEAKRIGLGVSVYTVDDPAVLERLMPLGLDNITTNNVEVALALKTASKE